MVDSSDRDQYQQVSIQGVSSADNSTRTNVQVDPITHRTLVDSIITSGFAIPEYDYISLTYVASGDGQGEIETATFKTGGSGGTTVATLTLTYNSDDEIATVTKT